MTKNFTRKMFGVSAFFLVTMIGNDAFAEEGRQFRPGSPEGQLEIMDKNKDATISADEFHGTEEMFLQLDSDSNGSITLTELKSGDRRGGRRREAKNRKREPQKLLDRMDTNTDGRISKEEFRGPAERFENVDSNKDGFLSLSKNWKICQNKEEAKVDGDTVEVDSKPLNFHISIKIV